MEFIDEFWEANRENWSTFLANRVDDGMERVIRNYVFGSLSVGCSKMHDSFSSIIAFIDLRKQKQS